MLQYGYVTKLTKGWEPGTLNVQVTKYNGDKVDTKYCSIQGFTISGNKVIETMERLKK